MRRSSQISQVGPKSSKHPNKRNTGEAPREQEKAIWPRRQRLERCSHKLRAADSPQKLGETKNRNSPETHWF